MKIVILVVVLAWAISGLAVTVLGAGAALPVLLTVLIGLPALIIAVKIRNAKNRNHTDPTRPYQS